MGAVKVRVVGYGRGSSDAHGIAPASACGDVGRAGRADRGDRQMRITSMREAIGREIVKCGMRDSSCSAVWIATADLAKASGGNSVAAGRFMASLGATAQSNYDRTVRGWLVDGSVWGRL